MYGIRGFLRKPYWTKTSQAFYEKLLKFIRENDNVLEFGSSTGHISMRLARGGYNITLLDDRYDIIQEAKKVYKFYNVKAKFVTKDFFEYNLPHDFIWNSGLIQCFSDEKKNELIKHISTLTNRCLLFYPDTDDNSKQLGMNSLQHPGVGDAIEYSVKNIPEISKNYFRNIEFGRISPSITDVAFDMIWIYMEA